MRMLSTLTATRALIASRLAGIERWVGAKNGLHVHSVPTTGLPPAAALALPQVRDELIDAVCKREMGVYTQIFSTMGETAKLERTVNRWAGVQGPREWGAAGGAHAGSEESGTEWLGGSCGLPSVERALLPLESVFL